MTKEKIEEDNFSYKIRYIRNLQFLLDSLIINLGIIIALNCRHISSLRPFTDHFFKMILLLAKRTGAEIRISISNFIHRV